LANKELSIVLWVFGILVNSFAERGSLLLHAISRQERHLDDLPDLVSVFIQYCFEFGTSFTHFVEDLDLVIDGDAQVLP